MQTFNGDCPERSKAYYIVLKRTFRLFLTKKQSRESLMTCSSSRCLPPQPAPLTRIV